MQSHAGTLEVKEGSHREHEEYWDKVSTMSSAEKQALGDWYPFKPEVRAQGLGFERPVL